MNRQDAIAEAHALAKQKGQPAAIYQRYLPRGTGVNDYSIQTLYDEAPGKAYIHVMTVSVTGLERKHGPWAGVPVKESV